MNDCLRVLADIRRLCENLELNKEYKVITDIQDLNHVPARPGVYWLETTMPVNKLSAAAKSILGKEKKYLTEKQLLVNQSAGGFYLCYMGTERSLSARLGQHLFNTNKHKERLGCDLNRRPFLSYNWRIWYAVIPNVTVRYAVESWWRHNKAWPPFCERGS